MTYYKPEFNRELAEEDRRKGRHRFRVYVLRTSCGHYVGHTSHLRNRMNDHRNGGVPSTQGLDVELAWYTEPYRYRYLAARFEAALKSLRQSRSSRFEEIVGEAPVLWSRKRRQDAKPMTAVRARPSLRRHRPKPRWKANALWFSAGLVVGAAVATAVGLAT